MERQKANGDSRECQGGHRYFVATTGALEATGEVFVIYICTACGAADMKKFQAAQPGTFVALSGPDIPKN